MIQPFDTYEKWVDAIIDEASDELNDWETNFIVDIQMKIANKWPLTSAQAEKLESIYAKYTS